MVLGVVFSQGIVWGKRGGQFVVPQGSKRGSYRQGMKSFLQFWKMAKTEPVCGGLGTAKQGKVQLTLPEKKHRGGERGKGGEAERFNGVLSKIPLK